MYYKNKIIPITRNTELNIEICTDEFTIGFISHNESGDGWWGGIVLPFVKIHFGIWYKNGPSAQ